MNTFSKLKLYSLALIHFTMLVTFSQPSTWSSRGVGGGGALFSPSINPTNYNEYFVACDMSELFHTSDFGLNYNQVDFNELQGGHNSKVCFTSTQGLLYSINYDNDMTVPVKSTDGGVTWTALAGNPDNSEETFSIFADYNNANRIIIAYYGTIYFSANGGTTFKSIQTNNNGITVGEAFFDGNNIYIGTSDGVLVSNNGGTLFSIATITGIPTGQKIWSFAAAKSNNITRFYCVTGDVADIYPGLVGSGAPNFVRGVYTVDYGTGNWLSKTSGITLSSDFVMFVAMAENDINTAYLAGNDGNTGNPLVMKTTNGGTLWTPIFNTANNQNITSGWCGQGGDRGWSYAEFIFGISVSPTNANYVIFTDLGFVHKTANGGTSWQQAYVSTASQHTAGVNTPKNANNQSIGLENTTCWQIHWSDANNMFACFSDIRGVRSTDAGANWSFNYTGHLANSMYRIAAHPTNGTLYAATSNIHDMYQSTRLADAQLDLSDAEGKVIYSTNKGATWQVLHTFSHPVFWIALDPNNPNRAYASVIHYNNGIGVGGIYRCDNLQNLASSTWTLLPNPPRTEKHPASIVVLNDGKVVCTYSGRRTSAGFTASSGTFVYESTGNSWTDVSHAGMHYWTKDVVIDPNDSQQNTWYVSVFSGWGGAPNGLGGLYKTINRGQTWTKINALDRVTSITFNPANTNQVYLTTEQDGLWMCNNINVANPSFTQLSNYPFRQPERVFFNPYNTNEIWVTSFGNGMKMGTLSPTGIYDFDNATDSQIQVFPNPVKDILNLPFSHDLSNSLQIQDIYGKELMSKEIDNSNNPSVSVAHLPKGVYFVRMGKVVKQFVKE